MFFKMMLCSLLAGILQIVKCYCLIAKLGPLGQSNFLFVKVGLLILCVKNLCCTDANCYFQILGIGITVFRLMLVHPLYFFCLKVKIKRNFSFDPFLDLNLLNFRVLTIILTTVSVLTKKKHLIYSMLFMPLQFSHLSVLVPFKDQMNQKVQDCDQLKFLSSKLAFLKQATSIIIK